VVTLAGCADRLLLYPTTDAIDAGTAVRRTICVAGANLEIWTARSSAANDPAAYVLDFTGNATRAEWIAGDLADLWSGASAEVWVVNYPGYGQSTGPATLKGIPAAALAAYDALCQHANGKPIYVSGESLGTTAALYVAASRPVAGLVLKNPPPLRQLILGRFGWWNLWLLAGPVALQIPRELDSLANARRVHAPAVFVMADADEVALPAYQRMVLGAYAGPKQVVTLKGAGHNSIMSPEATDQLRQALDWLRSARQ